MLQKPDQSWKEELYYLNRDNLESRRLDLQHGIWTESLEYALHPKVRAELPPNPVIVDVGTGTGVWLLDVAATFHGHGQFFGFDISDAQYPAPDTLPSNVHLGLGDIRKPFPEHLLGTFDVVHCRLLVLAMNSESEWAAAACNLRTLLKPGGWLQWEELDPMQRQVLRGRSVAQTQTRWLQHGFDHLIQMTGERTVNVPGKLLSGIHRAGFSPVARDVVSTDRIPEMRHKITVNETGVVLGVSKQQAAAGAPGAWTLEQVNEVVDHMLEEARAGAYVNVHIHCIFARNPDTRGKM